jgi:hypothetical protein
LTVDVYKNFGGDFGDDCSAYVKNLYLNGRVDLPVSALSSNRALIAERVELVPVFR